MINVNQYIKMNILELIILEIGIIITGIYYLRSRSNTQFCFGETALRVRSSCGMSFLSKFSQGTLLWGSSIGVKKGF